MNGDGAVTTADLTLYRPQIGTVLPVISMTATAVDSVLATADAIGPGLEAASTAATSIRLEHQ